MGKVIMTADDSASIRQMVSFTLRQAGYEIIEAVDGKDALDKLAGTRIDMLIADLNMPNLDGLGLLRAGSRGLGVDREALQARPAPGSCQESPRLGVCRT